ncbi:Disease resistance protein L6 [Linum grandiflorum]
MRDIYQRLTVRQQETDRTRSAGRKIILFFKWLFGRKRPAVNDTSAPPSDDPPSVTSAPHVASDPTGASSTPSSSSTTFTPAPYTSPDFPHLLTLPTGEYEVFLSFRGPDTRHQITDIIYRFLVHLKIRTFRDDDELRKGEGIWPNLVGTLKGWHVKNNDEQGSIADLVSNIVWSHLSKSNEALLDITDELVGIDDHVKAVVDSLSLDSSEGMVMVGIHGVGGVGKTTLATAVYNKIFTRFDRCCFLEKIRETQQRKDGNLILQKKLISEILRMDSVESIKKEVVARKLIRDRVSEFKILVVLDDVDDTFKFEDILGHPKKFIPGSRFIATSRNTRVLRSLNQEQCKLYSVDVMGFDRSLQLFCKHAFRKDSPPPDFDSLS